MAEGLLKKMARDNGWLVETQSAGLAAFKGIPAAHEAVEVCREKGIDISGHQSQPLSKTLVFESNWIITMTQRHKEAILRRVPDLMAKVILLSEFAGQGEVDVEDPVGQSVEEYRNVFNQIEGYLSKAKERLSS
jgi:protein-tyrosine-phosphatase